MMLCVLLNAEEDLPSSCTSVHPAQPVPTMARVGLEESIFEGDEIDTWDGCNIVGVILPVGALKSMLLAL